MVEVFKVTDDAVKAVTKKLFDDAGLDPAKKVEGGREDWETESAAVREELTDLTFKLNQLFTSTTVK